MIKKQFNNQLQKSVGVVLLVISGAASAALPPVVDGAGKGYVPVPEKNATSGVVGMYNKLQRLQMEVQQLRGQVEEQTYTIESLKKRQRDLYLDTDRRLQALESAGRPPIASQNNSEATPALANGQPTANASGDNVKQAGEIASAAAVVSDKQAYDAAFSTLKAGRYKQAISSFSGFVTTYPNSVYIPNALYWLGEASYVTRDYDGALAEFNKVVMQHSSHSKAKDALLKIGFIQYEKKQWADARKTLQSVTSKHSGTTVAKLAQQRLERMLKEKH